MENPHILVMEEELDGNPFDWTLRSILADAYTDLGEEELSLYYRWTSLNRKSPTNQGGFWDNTRWGWSSHSEPNHPEGLGYLWPEVNYGVGETPQTMRYYNSRKEAEECLRVVLARHSFEVDILMWDSRQWNKWMDVGRMARGEK